MLEDDDPAFVNSEPTTMRPTDRTMISDAPTMVSSNFSGDPSDRPTQQTLLDEAEADSGWPHDDMDGDAPRGSQHPDAANAMDGLGAEDDDAGPKKNNRVSWALKDTADFANDHGSDVDSEIA